MLIFETSACPDYVPPQMSMAMDKLLVPVLIGGGNLTNLVPSHSYIAARSFVCSAEEQEQSNQSFCQTIRNMTICQKICVTFLDSPLVGEAVNRPAR